MPDQNAVETRKDRPELWWQTLDVNLNLGIPGTNEQLYQHPNPHYEVIQKGSVILTIQVLSSHQV